MRDELTFPETVNATGTFLKSVIIAGIPHDVGVFKTATGQVYVAQSTVPKVGGQHYKLPAGGYESKYNLTDPTLGLTAGRNFMVVQGLNIKVPNEAPGTFDEVAHLKRNLHTEVVAGLDAAFDSVLKGTPGTAGVTEAMADMRLGTRTSKLPTAGGFTSPVRAPSTARVAAGSIKAVPVGVVKQVKYAKVGSLEGHDVFVKQPSTGGLHGLTTDTLGSVGGHPHIAVGAIKPPKGGVQLVLSDAVPPGAIRVGAHGFVENIDHPAFIEPPSAGLDEEDAPGSLPAAIQSAIDAGRNQGRALADDDGYQGLGEQRDGFGAVKKPTGALRLPTARMPPGAFAQPAGFQLSNV